jgi:endonuclease YncB( thermonuclease family)
MNGRVYLRAFGPCWEKSERLSALRLFCALASGLLAILAASVITSDVSAASRKRPTHAVVKGPSCPTSGIRSVGFAKALDGETFTTTDGTQVRLAGVLAPPETRDGALPSTAEAAQAALTASLRTGALTLATEASPDRYGRVSAQVFAGGAWVQGALLRAGVLRVVPDPASAPCTRELIAAENQARDARTGHWRDGIFSLRTPDQLAGRAGTFQTVEGTVTTATTYKGRGYINFGADYRTDFTVTVAPVDMKTFRSARFDVRKLAGKRVRVRGWVELYNGPEMEIATPAAVETLN